VECTVQRRLKAKAKSGKEIEQSCAEIFTPRIYLVFCTQSRLNSSVKIGLHLDGVVKPILNYMRRPYPRYSWYQGV
jgi:hypothetical protein